MEMREMVIEDLRLAILQLLEADHDGSHNERILLVGLGRAGHHVDRDTLITQLGWLKNQGYVTTEEVELVGVVAQISEAGESVATGRVPKVHGVAKMSPRKRMG